MSGSIGIDTGPKYLFFDVEVDSVQKEPTDPPPCITQIGLYCPTREKTDRAFDAHISPPDDLKRKSEELNFGRGGKAPAKHTFKVVWPYLKEWVNKDLNGNQKVVFIMHNGYEHDWPILKNELARFGESIPVTWKPFCTLYLSRALHLPGDCSLPSLVHTYGVKKRKFHDAYNDARMLSDVFAKMIGKADLNKVLTAMLEPAHPVRAAAAAIKSHGIAMLVFFDFEATGLFPKKGDPGDNPRAVELAGYIPEKDVSFSSLIHPGCPIPAESSEIHGIYDKDVEGNQKEHEASKGAVALIKRADDFKHVWTKFEKWIEENSGSTSEKVICLAGHNIWGYDIPLYESECERVGLSKKRWKSFDTYFLSKSLFKGIKNVSHKLQELRKMFNIPEDQAHRAAGDVRVNWKVFQKFTEGLSTEKVSQAIMSPHPILTLKAAIFDHGKFKPKTLIAAQSSSSSSSSAVGSWGGPSGCFFHELSHSVSSSSSSSSSSHMSPAVPNPLGAFSLLASSASALEETLRFNPHSSGSDSEGEGEKIGKKRRRVGEEIEDSPPASASSASSSSSSSSSSSAVSSSLSLAKESVNSGKKAKKEDTSAVKLDDEWDLEIVVRKKKRTEE